MPETVMPVAAPIKVLAPVHPRSFQSLKVREGHFDPSLLKLDTNSTCKLTKKRGRDLDFYIHQSEEVNAVPFIGIELEGRYGGGSKVEREIRHKISNLTDEQKREFNIPLNVFSPKPSTTTSTSNPYEGALGNGLYSVSSLAHKTLQEILSRKYKHLIYDYPHHDGGGIESVCRPTSELAFKNLKPSFTKILSLYKELGFTDQLPGAGIHIYMDYILFGDTKEVQTENIKKFLWFLYINGEEMVTICKREYSSQLSADIIGMIDVQNGRLQLEDETQMYDTFMDIKDDALNAFRSNSQSRYFNIHFNRDGRPAIEFRWFSSTMNIEVFMAFGEFAFAVTSWLKQTESNESLDIKFFCNFIKDNLEKYPHLFEYFSSIPELKDYMNDTGYINIMQKLQDIPKTREKIPVIV